MKTNSTYHKETFSRTGIIKAATEYYKDLYAYRIPLSIESLPLQKNYNAIQRFSDQEIYNSMKTLKKEKSSGPDGISNEAISTGKALLVQPLTILFNKILEDKKIPAEWAKSDIVLLYKKGNPKDINNYRPISLQSNLYKLFASCLEKRLAKYTEKHQAIEQAGFRSTYSTIDHIHSLELIIEKYEEMNRPLYLAFIDYAKAFDSISHLSIWKALQECDVPSETIELIQDIYKKSTSRIILDKTGAEIDICRGVRQGDPLSPRIFITVLQNIMKALKWENKGININGQFLSNLRFADDIILFSENSSQLESMINEINYISNEIGLELNTSKTKIMTNSKISPIHINNVLLEYVQEYTYLGKQVSFKKSRHQDELLRRINMAWNKFWSFKEILKSNTSVKLKKIVLDSCILPSLTYASQTWIFNKKTRKKVITTQRAMERSILNLKLRYKKRSTDIRKITRLVDALEHCKRLKWKWAGHIARMNDDRWAKKITSWKGPVGKRSRGRPKERWQDEILKLAGKDWTAKACDRTLWRKMEEAFTLREVLNK